MTSISLSAEIATVHFAQLARARRARGPSVADGIVAHPDRPRRLLRRRGGHQLATSASAGRRTEEERLGRPGHHGGGRWVVGGASSGTADALGHPHGQVCGRDSKDPPRARTRRLATDGRDLLQVRSAAPITFSSTKRDRIGRMDWTSPSIGTAIYVGEPMSALRRGSRTPPSIPTARLTGRWNCQHRVSRGVRRGAPLRPSHSFRSFSCRPSSSRPSLRSRGPCPSPPVR